MVQRDSRNEHEYACNIYNDMIIRVPNVYERVFAFHKGSPQDGEIKTASILHLPNGDELKKAYFPV